jgi:hypothetical protein
MLSTWIYFNAAELIKNSENFQVLIFFPSMPPKLPPKGRKFESGYEKHKKFKLMMIFFI